MVSSKSGYPTLRDDWFHLEPQGSEILQLNNKNLCGGHRQAVKTMDCGSIMRGFESHCPPHLQKDSHNENLFSVKYSFYLASKEKYPCFNFICLCGILCSLNISFIICLFSDEIFAPR